MAAKPFWQHPGAIAMFLLTTISTLIGIIYADDMGDIKEIKTCSAKNSVEIVDVREMVLEDRQELRGLDTRQSNTERGIERLESGQQKILDLLWEMKKR